MVDWRIDEEKFGVDFFISVLCADVNTNILMGVSLFV